jgi:hypothetical protein
LKLKGYPCKDTSFNSKEGALKGKFLVNPLYLSKISLSTSLQTKDYPIQERRSTERNCDGSIPGMLLIIKSLRSFIRREDDEGQLRRDSTNARIQHTTYHGLNTAKAFGCVEIHPLSSPCSLLGGWRSFSINSSSTLRMRPGEFEDCGEVVGVDADSVVSPSKEGQRRQIIRLTCSMKLSVWT